LNERSMVKSLMLDSIWTISER